MERGERDRYLEGVIEKVNQQMREHTAKLHSLETEHGFSLDVATDIYGLGLLDHTKPSQEIIDRWKTFFDALATDDTDTILICQVKKELEPGCYGFGQREKYRYPVRSTLIKTTETSHLVYRNATTEADSTTPACITLENVQTATVEPLNSHAPLEWMTGPVVIAQPYDTKIRIGDLTAAAFDTGPLGNGNDYVVFKPITDHKDVLDASNQLSSCGATMGYFLLRPFDDLLELSTPSA